MARIFASLAFLLVFTAVPVFADTVVKRGNTTYVYKGDKPPIVIDNGRTRYIIPSESEKMREILLRADRIKIVRKKKDNDWQDDHYKNYYRHNRNIRDHEHDPNSTSYYSGYGAGYLISRDRD